MTHISEVGGFLWGRAGNILCATPAAADHPAADAGAHHHADEVADPDRPAAPRLGERQRPGVGVDRTRAAGASSSNSAARGNRLQVGMYSGDTVRAAGSIGPPHPTPQPTRSAGAAATTRRTNRDSVGHTSRGGVSSRSRIEDLPGFVDDARGQLGATDVDGEVATGHAARP